MTDNAHSPTPWRYTGDGWLISADGETIASVSRENVADLPHIVTAVNAHQDLVEALKQCSSRLFNLYDGQDYPPETTLEILDRARAVLERIK